MVSVCRSSFWFAVLTRAYPYIMVYLLSVILKFNWFYYTPESLRCQPHESKKSWIYRLFIIAKMIWQLFDSACTKKSCTGEHHRLVGSETPLSCIKKNQPKFKRRGGGVYSYYPLTLSVDSTVKNIGYRQSFEQRDMKELWHHEKRVSEVSKTDW